MHLGRKIRYHKVLLIACDAIDWPLWSLPLITPSPTPRAFYICIRRQLPRKIHLVPLQSSTEIPVVACSG